MVESIYFEILKEMSIEGLANFLSKIRSVKIRCCWCGWERVVMKVLAHDLKKIIVICIVILLIIRTFFYDLVIVSGDSMKNSFHNGELLFIEKKISSPERFDVVVCDTGRSGKDKIIIKRIIALPGETIQIIDGCVFINSEKLDDIITTKIDYAGIAENEIVLQEKQYFLLGDNRNESGDSRYDWIGVVEKIKLLEKCYLKL